MAIEIDADIFDEEDIEFITTTPRYLRIGLACKERNDLSSETTPVTISYGMATEEQIAALFTPFGRPKGEPVGSENFNGRYCYEAWIGKKLVGICSLQLSGAKYKDNTVMSLSLEAIYVKPRYRGKGIARELCEYSSGLEFERILTFILSDSEYKSREYLVFAGAELLSRGGQSAIINICEEIEADAERLSEVHGVNIRVDSDTDNWCTNERI
ncbi:GNAT family N-acetyltransferase [Pseudomonas qingdaonensis]|uniref:GNAT family N-acetyltransferase n=1 Tax=Pseudomonas TaxID=286 RepID=UPI0021191085|nr:MULTISPECIES: GNAT family N-acetyltransferase [Pseudomonas]UXH55993.1 GNAT family N-acetyltransferase [Pseudomonas aeruginosa]UXH69012.1 GNAT family N-acetyltransferase [Pseudomonas aeruginosa]WKL67225.1 GNAT family N-acetyltransferase [Pseudomonas qingdaonensis]